MCGGSNPLLDANDMNMFNKILFLTTIGMTIVAMVMLVVSSDRAQAERWDNERPEQDYQAQIDAADIEWFLENVTEPPPPGATNFVTYRNGWYAYEVDGVTNLHKYIPKIGE